MAENKFGLVIGDILPDHWVLGGATSKVSGAAINPSGDWTKWLPPKSPQFKNGVETQNCTGFGTCNAVETHVNFLEHPDGNLSPASLDYSDRYLGIEAGTNPQTGNNPHTVAETWRKVCGAIPEMILPFDDSIKTPAEYYRPKPVPSFMLKSGVNWYAKYQMSHEWVFTSGTPEEKRNLLKAALQRGTVCVSVFGWAIGPNGFTRPDGAVDNHWVQLVCYNERNQPVVFDSYDAYIKELDPLYDFGIAKVYHVTKTPQPEAGKNQTMKKPCTNFTAGRGGHAPVGVVIHIMQGTLAGTDAWFANPASGVSAHYGIGMGGEIHQYVDEKDTAWHAGNVMKPDWNLIQKGVNPNLLTIGIENEGYDLANATQPQLDALAGLVADICGRWGLPIDPSHVIGHFDINSSVKRNCPSPDRMVIGKVIALAKVAYQKKT